MVAFLVASLLFSPLAYDIKPREVLEYDFKVSMDGFLPVLGGNEGKADISFGVRVVGMEPVGDHLQVTNELTSCLIKFNGAKVPLTLANVVDFFPKTTVEFAPSGKIIKNDAPDRKLPFRLPGLDVKRFPDITYLPLEFTDTVLDVGKSWTFKKTFGESDLFYTCSLSSIEKDEATIAVAVTQEYDALENDSAEMVKDAKDAESRVHTNLVGTGVVKFDLKLGRAKSVHMLNKSVSKLTNLVTKAETERRLDSTLDFTLKTPVAPIPSRPMPKLSLWQQARNFGEQVWQDAAQGLATMKLAFQVMLIQAPGLGGFLAGWLNF